jgi:hypothetical protein
MPNEDCSQEVTGIFALLQQCVYGIMDDVALSPVLREGEFSAKKLQKPR